MTQISPSLYDEKKASEVAFYFLMRARALGGSVTKLRLLKWMYLAERLAYQQFGEPLTGDVLTSMQHGPVPDTTRKHIERPAAVAARNGSWESVVAVEDGPKHKHQYVSIRPSCGYVTADDLRQLSDAEVEMLDEVWMHFGKWNSGQLEKYLHDRRHTPEWKWAPGDKSNPIELETLLGAVGYEEDEISSLVKNIQATESIHAAFSRE